jgi:hypothetical protein
MSAANLILLSGEFCYYIIALLTQFILALYLSCNLHRQKAKDLYKENPRISVVDYFRLPGKLTSCLKM